MVQETGKEEMCVELAWNIIEMVLPVIAMIGLGYLCRVRGYFNSEGLAGLKAVIGNITLPVVLFNAFFTAEYNSRVLLVFLVVYVGFGVALGFGFLTRGFVKPYGKFMPFLLTSAEGGMLGYALYALIAGDEAVSVFATVDIGQTVFAYTVFLSVLKITDGQKAEPKDILKNVVTNKACIGMALGILLGVTNGAKVIQDSAAGGVVTELISFVTAPTAGLILIIVGYELELKRELLVPVVKTIFLRLAILALVLAAGSLVIFSVTPFDKDLFMALLLMYSLPAPFIIPLFADTGEDSAYISTTLSAGTLVTIVCFIGIAVYSAM